MKRLKRVALFVVFLCGLAVFAAPAGATGQNAARGMPASTAFDTAPPFAPGMTPWNAPDGEHCEVPVLNWVRLGQQFFPRQCSSDKRERARVTVRANLDKFQPMSLIVEWQVVRNGKTGFRCTGPKTLFYDDSNQMDQIYRLTAKAGTDIQAVNLYVTVYGWSNLNWNTTGGCVNAP